MHTWWRVVCDEHKEMTHLVVSTWPGEFLILAKDYRSSEDEKRDDERITAQFLDKHWACELRLVQRDDHLDVLWDTYHEVDGRVYDGKRWCFHCRKLEQVNG